MLFFQIRYSRAAECCLDRFGGDNEVGILNDMLVDEFFPESCQQRLWVYRG